MENVVVKEKTYSIKFDMARCINGCLIQKMFPFLQLFFSFCSFHRGNGVKESTKIFCLLTNNFPASFHPPHQQQQALQAQQVLMASEINQESFREYARFRQSILTSTHPHHRLSGSPDDASLNEEHRRKKNNEVTIQKITTILFVILDTL